MPTPTTRRRTTRSPLQKEVKKELEKEYRTKLKLAADKPLPKEIQGAIDKKSVEVTSVIAEQFVGKSAIATGKAMFRPDDPALAIGERLGSALAGVKVVSQSADLDKILAENAKMLKKKYEALKTAGFTEDQSFQLILAEVSAKKSS
jgi:hypothetical protein